MFSRQLHLARCIYGGASSWLLSTQLKLQLQQATGRQGAGTWSLHAQQPHRTHLPHLLLSAPSSSAQCPHWEQDRRPPAGQTPGKARGAKPREGLESQEVAKQLLRLQSRGHCVFTPTTCGVGLRREQRASRQKGRNQGRALPGALLSLSFRWRQCYRPTHASSRHKAELAAKPEKNGEISAAAAQRCVDQPSFKAISSSQCTEGSHLNTCPLLFLARCLLT